MNRPVTSKVCDMDDDKAKQMRWLLSELGQEGKSYSERLEKLIEDFRGGFQRDYAGTVGAIGAVLALSSIGLLGFTEQVVGGCLALSFGAAMIVVAAIIKHRVALVRARKTAEMLHLEQELLAAKQKSVLVKHIGMFGELDALNIGQLQFLIGNPKEVPTEVFQQKFEWTPLPPPKDKDANSDSESPDFF